MDAPTVRARRLSKTYRVGLSRQTVRALDGVDLEVGRGEVFGLLGPNGAGKTTLVKILLGITRPDTGQAAVLGQAAGQVAVRRRIGYLPEGHRYPLHLTGAGVVRWFARLSDVPRAEIDARVTALLRRVGMERWAKVRLRKYSKGMVQRLGLAVALVHRPEVLFLDEPTDGVDPIGRREIREILLEEKARGTTIFINSHLLSEIEKTCDRVAILSRGTVLRTGTIASLTARALAFRVAADPMGDAALGALRARARAAERVDGEIRLEVEDLAQLNACLDDLRVAGILLREVRAERSTLEDTFIELLEGGEARP